MKKEKKPLEVEKGDIFYFSSIHVGKSLENPVSVKWQESLNMCRQTHYNVNGRNTQRQLK
jgi:hypothetical protein